MGNTRSVNLDQEEDVWWTNSRANKEIAASSQTRTNANDQADNTSLDDFKSTLVRKRERRKQIIAAKRKEMQDLRDEITKLKAENEELRRSDCNRSFEESIQRLEGENEHLQNRVHEMEEELRNYENITEMNRELRVNIGEIQAELQHLNTEIVSFEQEREDYKAHVVALKDVIRVSKQMLLIREGQLKELKQKVEEIEATVASKEINIYSANLKAEYEKQLQNIRNLRIYYEERQRADYNEKEELRALIDDTKKELEDEKRKNSELIENVNRLEKDNSKKYDEIKNLESNLGLTKAECRQYQAEMAVINQLFSQILMGFNHCKEIDIDKLIKQLEENHDLLQNIVKNEESSAVSSALPKVLLDLVNEVSDKEHLQDDLGDKQHKLETIVEETESQTSSLHQFNSAAEIVENLPKVWRVLIELLSHQSAPVNALTDDNKKDENPCYKLVETPKGPSLVLSVSQTFIRLKDLILEKKSLEKETLHMKQLNTHLETRLQDQEKRLENVTDELSKTWHIVGKLQKQHQLLHTQEKILRYELAQKRKLLTDLKEELEYSREKWQQAREKNSDTERQWEQLRIEFASRRTAVHDDLNNSVESGYSDERECSSSDDEPGYETDMSESNQKADNDTDNTTESSPIMAVIRDEIVDIEEMADHTNNVEIAHSDNKPKTDDDLVQSDEKTEEEAQGTCGGASEQPKRTLDEILKAKEERLKRLEGLATNLVKQVTNTTNRSVAICNRLEDLHEIYGETSTNHGQQPDSEEDKGEKTTSKV